MYIYWKIILGAVLLSLNSALWAQCGAGIPAGGNPNCIPPDVYHSQGMTQSPANEATQQPIIIRQKWADRWGAMVLDNKKIAYGMITGEHTESRAREFARNKCLQMGGILCNDVYSYKNSCGAVVIKKGGGYVYSNAKTEDEAAKEGISLCNSQRKECEIFYTGCSHAEAVPIR